MLGTYSARRCLSAPPPSLTRLTEPVVEPVTIHELAKHAHIDRPSDDFHNLWRYIRSARRYVESETERTLCACDWRMVWPAGWPPDGRLVLRRGPVRSVTSIAYGGATPAFPITLASTAYTVHLAADPAVVVPSYAAGYAWPDIAAGDLYDVAVTYTAGYGAGPADVPEELRQAVLLLAAYYVAQREAGIIGQSMDKAPFGLDGLLAHYRDVGVG